MKKFRVIMLHPVFASDGAMLRSGNLRWSLGDNEEIRKVWEAGAETLRKKLYFISPFPEGGG